MSDNQQEFLGRIDQLDAKLLDNELLNTLKRQINFAFSLFSSSGIQPHIRYGPELNVLLKSALYYATIIQRNASVGQDLLSIKLDKDISSRKKLTFGIMLLNIPEYLVERKDLFFGKMSSTIEKLLEKLSLIFNLCSFINSIIFLQQGKYPTLIERIVGVKYQRAESHERYLAYEYLSRELLWHSLKELLTFVIPLVNLQKLKFTMGRILPSLKSDMCVAEFSEMNHNRICHLCNLPITIPSTAGCSHAYCYFCLSSVINDSGSCLACSSSLARENMVLLKNSRGPML